MKKVFAILGIAIILCGYIFGLKYGDWYEMLVYSTAASILIAFFIVYVFPRKRKVYNFDENKQ